MSAITQAEIDQQVLQLYDEYCHGRIDRRARLRDFAFAGLRQGADHLVHRYAHQGALRDLSVARRHTQHGFHNNSTPRYNEAAAKLSWERTGAFFKRNLA